METMFAVLAAAIVGTLIGRSLRPPPKSTNLVVDLENLKVSALAQINAKADALYSESTVSDDLFGKELADIRKKWRSIEK
jgi:hypothetical protein